MLGELIQLRVVSLSPSAAGASSYILFLQAEATNHLGFPMVIGLNEAQAISMYIEEIIPARPLTHDLIVNMINTANLEISHIEISSFQDGVFYANIVGSNNGQSFRIDARPSDSIAIALRLKISIFIKEILLNEIAIPLDNFAEHELEVEDEIGIPGTSMEEVKNSLEESLAKALAEENYEEAAKLRDQLNQLTK